MQTIWTEGNSYHLLRADRSDISRYIEVRRYKRDVVIELVTYDPSVTRNAWTGYGWEDIIVPDRSLIAVNSLYTNQELIRAAIKWYETGEWSLETSDEESE
jgi:hypothetical protein